MVSFCLNSRLNENMKIRSEWSPLEPLIVKYNWDLEHINSGICKNVDGVLMSE